MVPDAKLSITPPVRLYQETKDFLRFLRTAALKHSVSIAASAGDSGTFTIVVPGSDAWNLDSFLQEIVLHGAKEVRKLLDKVHSLRTRGLHRLEHELPDSDIAKIAQDIYSTFEWIDDYAQAQMERTVRLSGKTYRRIRYGKEPLWKGPTKEDAALWKRQAEPSCHDCGVIEGELHLDGCDWERCPRCKGQNLGCPCRTEEDH